MDPAGGTSDLQQVCEVKRVWLIGLKTADGEEKIWKGKTKWFFKEGPAWFQHEIFVLSPADTQWTRHWLLSYNIRFPKCGTVPLICSRFCVWYLIFFWFHENLNWDNLTVKTLTCVSAITVSNVSHWTFTVQPVRQMYGGPTCFRRKINYLAN